jgi:hypothetical protein
MKRTRSITTTVTVQPSDVEFVPKLGDVPNETTAEHRRRIVRECLKRYLENPKNRKRYQQGINAWKRRKRLEKKLKKTA